MNHYPKHVGDYAKDTMGLTQGEHGAYNLLMDASYATESGIPVDEVYAISRVATAAERRCTDRVLAKFFYLRDGRYYQKRIEEEIATYRDKSAKASKSANKRWGKGAPPIPSGIRTHSEGTAKDDASAVLANSHEPIIGKRFPGREGTGVASAKPIALAEVRIEPNTPAARLAAICGANGIRDFDQFVLEWAREACTPEQLIAAIATARLPRRKGGEVIPAAYLDPIVRDRSKAVDSGWRHDDRLAERLCTELGIRECMKGEERRAWHRRIDAALTGRALATVKGQAEYAAAKAA